MASLRRDLEHRKRLSGTDEFYWEVAIDDEEAWGPPETALASLVGERIQLTDGAYNALISRQLDDEE